MKRNTTPVRRGSNATRQAVYPWKLRRMAVSAHPNRSHQIKWLAAVSTLGDKWIVAKPIPLGGNT